MPFIDWSPFFHTWELRGRYPGIFDDPYVGKQARELYHDARTLLDKIVDGALFHARAVYGFYPANRVGDDIELYTDETRERVLTTFHSLRQQAVKPAGQHHHALADYIAPKESGRADYLGAFAVTTGHGTEELVAKFEREHDDYSKIMTQALADRLAEAFAESLHRRARLDWGYGREEADLTPDDLIREKYRGIRPAPGYPRVPRPHRKADDLPAAGRGEGNRDHADGKLRDASGEQRERVVFRASRQQIFRRGQAGPRPDRRLRRTQGDAAGDGGAMARSLLELRAGEALIPTGECPGQRLERRPARQTDGREQVRRRARARCPRAFTGAEACPQPAPDALGPALRRAHTSPTPRRWTGPARAPPARWILR